MPEIGVLRIPQHDFAQDFSDFSFQSHLTKLEVITAIQKIMTENQKVLKVSPLGAWLCAGLLGLHPRWTQLEPPSHPPLFGAVMRRGDGCFRASGEGVGWGGGLRC